MIATQQHPYSSTTHRARQAPDASIPSGERPQNIRYPGRFVRIPNSIDDYIADGTLKAVDMPVLKALLRFRQPANWWCWTTKEVIGSRVKRKPRTVQRAFDRLAQVGLIEHRRVAIPDPEDPANEIGWRIVFPWLAPDGYVPGPGPERRGKGVRKGTREAHGETFVSPQDEAAQETPVSPREETFVAPKEPYGSERSEQERKKTSSSSAPSPSPDDDDESFVASPPEENSGGIQSLDAEAMGAVEAARECFGEALASIIQADGQHCVRDVKAARPWGAFEAAIYAAHRALRGQPPRDPLRYFTTTANKDYAGGMTADLAAYRATLRAGRRAEAERAERKRQEEAEAERVRRERLEQARGVIDAVTALGWLLAVGDGRARVVRYAPSVEAPDLPAEVHGQLNELWREVVAILEKSPAPTADELAALKAIDAQRSAARDASSPWARYRRGSATEVNPSERLDMIERNLPRNNPLPGVLDAFLASAAKTLAGLDPLVPATDPLRQRFERVRDWVRAGAPAAPMEDSAAETYPGGHTGEEYGRAVTGVRAKWKESARA